MDTISAVVVESEGKYSIVIGDEDSISIPMSEDDPNEVKRSFRKIILRLKKGIFQIKFVETEQDLFSQVAKEYITQLNKEIIEVHGEMKQHGLLQT